MVQPRLQYDGCGFVIDVFATAAALPSAVRAQRLRLNRAVRLVPEHDLGAAFLPDQIGELFEAGSDGRRVVPVPARHTEDEELGFELGADGGDAGLSGSPGLGMISYGEASSRLALYATPMRFVP